MMAILARSDVLLNRPIERRPFGLLRFERYPAGRERRAGLAGIGHAIEAEPGKPGPAGMGTDGADLPLARHHWNAAVGHEAIGRHRHDPVARRAAMLHARHHLLADIT